MARRTGACAQAGDLPTDPIRRVFIPKANGKLRPLGIATLRDRVCMTAAMLVREPIVEADLPSEQYAYRAGRNTQQAVVEVQELLFRHHPEVVDADLADYFGSIPQAELMLSIAHCRSRNENSTSRASRSARCFDQWCNSWLRKRIRQWQQH